MREDKQEGELLQEIVIFEDLDITADFRDGFYSNAKVWRHFWPKFWTREETQDENWKDNEDEDLREREKSVFLKILIFLQISATAFIPM